MTTELATSIRFVQNEIYFKAFFQKKTQKYKTNRLMCQIPTASATNQMNEM